MANDNPFSDLIPTQSQSTNPFHDLIPEQSNTQKAASYVNAAGSAVREGIMDGMGNTADLVGTVLKKALQTVTPKSVDDKLDQYQQTARLYGNKFKDAVNQGDQIGQEAKQQNPKTAAGGYGLGNVGASIIGGNLVAKPLVAGTAPILSRLAPNLLKSSPTAMGFVEQAPSGAVIGAASDENNPMRGAILGGLTAGTLGAASGFAGNRAQQGAAIINRTQKNAEITGADPSSQAVKDEIRQNLVNKGRVFKTEDTTAQIRNTISSKIGLDDFDPKAVKAQTKALYAPLDKAPAPVELNNTNKILQESSVPSLGLPKKTLPEQPTIKDLRDYNIKVNRLKNQAFTQASSKGNGNSTYEDGEFYQKLSNSIEKDITASAEAQGLGNQFREAQDFYHKTSNEGLVFEAFKQANKADGFKLGRFSSTITKLSSSKKVSWTPEQKQMISGLKTVIDAAHQRLKAPGLEARNPGVFKTIYDGLTNSDYGIALLQKIGSMSPTAKVTKGILNDFFTGLAAHSVGSQDSEENSQ